jgi:hypothetical protein
MYTGFKLTLTINNVTAARALIESLMKRKYLATEMPDDSKLPHFNLTYNQFWNEHSTDFEFTATFCAKTHRLSLHCWGNAQAVDTMVLLDDLSPLHSLIPISPDAMGVVEGCYIEDETERDELIADILPLTLPLSWCLGNSAAPLKPLIQGDHHEYTNPL